MATATATATSRIVRPPSLRPAIGVLAGVGRDHYQSRPAGVAGAGGEAAGRAFAGGSMVNGKS